MCTAAAFQTKDFYFGRTLDYECSYGECVTVTPRRYPFSFRHMGRLDAHYAMIGMAHVADGYPLYYDAVNEAGLGMAGLNFVGNAQYAEVQEGKENVAQFELIPWILGRCATVREARARLDALNLVGTPFSERYPAAQLHWLAGGIGELGADDLERAGRGRGGRGRDVLFSRSLLRGGIGRSLGLRFQRILGPLRRLFHHQGIRSSGRGQTAHRRSQGHADAREHHEHRHRDADAREPCPSRRLSHGTLTSRASQPAHFQGLRGPLVLHQARHCTPPRAPA